jgi:hypothetical protein
MYRSEGLFKMSRGWWVRALHDVTAAQSFSLVQVVTGHYNWTRNHATREFFTSVAFLVPMRDRTQ